MRQIEFIKLHNFKVFADQTVKLNNLTLLSGLNGSGKSTVMQALAMLRQSYQSGFLVQNGWLLNGSYVELGTGADLLHQDFADDVISLEMKSTDSDFSQAWSVRPEVDADVLTPETGLAQSGMIGGFNVFDSGFQYLRADRITPSVTFPKSQHAVRTDRSLGCRGEYTAHFLLEFGAEEIEYDNLRHPNDRETTSLLGQVNAWMQEFSPGVRVEPKAIPMTDMVRLSYSFKGKGAGFGNALRATNVGFGLTHALPIITACLASHPGMLILIENPEAQLHPRGQSAIGRLIALAAQQGVQIIVETHSDHVLNGIRLAAKEGALNPKNTALYFFSREDNHRVKVETPLLDSDGRLSFWPRNFFDEWDRTLDSLIS
jgi:predicted ATPase